MSANIGWLFYKDYFKDLNYEDLKKSEQNIKEKVANIIKQTPSIEKTDPLGNISFNATTTYPGLLLGSGNAHELPSVEGQAILGFHFDYTSGLPVVQGSSIKGVLRSAFKHPEYIQDILEDKSFDVKALEKEIFDNSDIFFDATILQADSFGKILGDDYLTPHKDPLKNPIPLRFIKVLPNVTFQFSFELRDSLLTKEQKALLFAQILSDLGIGAKTNVGYGKFTDDLVSKTKLSLEAQKDEAQKAQEQKKLLAKKAEEEAQLASLDSNVEKIKFQLNTLTDNKDIFDSLSAFELTKEEQQEVVKILEEKIGPKPAPKNKASIKWAIKIYEFLGK